MRIFMPIIMTIIFVLYVLYLLLVKREFKSKLKTVIFPGVFFIIVWSVYYFVFLR
jgi:hypothetical protein